MDQQVLGVLLSLLTDDLDLEVHAVVLLNQVVRKACVSDSAVQDKNNIKKKREGRK